MHTGTIFRHVCGAPAHTYCYKDHIQTCMWCAGAYTLLQGPYSDIYVVHRLIHTDTRAILRRVCACCTGPYTLLQGPYSDMSVVRRSMQIVTCTLLRHIRRALSHAYPVTWTLLRLVCFALERSFLIHESFSDISFVRSPIHSVTRFILKYICSPPVHIHCYMNHTHTYLSCAGPYILLQGPSAPAHTYCYMDHTQTYLELYRKLKMLFPLSDIWLNEVTYTLLF